MAAGERLVGYSDAHHDDHLIAKVGSAAQIGPTARRSDPEKAEGFEKIVLEVKGMTCSGCGNKVARMLESISGVSNVRVNFVMGNVNFNLDSSALSVEEVIKTAERASGFNFTWIMVDHQQIDLLMRAATAEVLINNMPLGMKLIERLEKHTYRVTCDPTVAGARSLLRSLNVRDNDLAPPRFDSSLTSGKKRLYEMLIHDISGCHLHHTSGRFCMGNHRGWRACAILHINCPRHPRSSLARS